MGDDSYDKIPELKEFLRLEQKHNEWEGEHDEFRPVDTLIVSRRIGWREQAEIEQLIRSQPR
jgi:hypothetical protein